MQSAPTRRTAPLALFAILVFVAALIVFSTKTRDYASDPPELSGPVWRASHGGTTYLAYVTSQERRRRNSTGVRRSFRYDPYVRFTLELRRIPDGAAVKRELLADMKGTRLSAGPRIAGVTGDILWLWRDSLEGRALPDLAMRHGPGTLTYRAPATREALPNDVKHFVVAPDSAAPAGTMLVARGRDARFYRIDAVSGAVETIDALALPRNTNSMRAEDRFDFIYPEARSSGITDFTARMNRSFGTPTGLWYALLSESDRQTLGSRPSAEDRPYGPVARSLYRAPFHRDHRGRPELELEKLEPVGSERLIQGGFLFRQWGRIWDVPDPSSSLVLAKARVGEDEPWQVLRLTRDGRVLWRTSTGLVTSLAFLDLDTHVLFVGLPLSDAARAGGKRASETIVWIDQVNGTRRAITIATGALDGTAP